MKQQSFWSWWHENGTSLGTLTDDELRPYQAKLMQISKGLDALRTLGYQDVALSPEFELLVSRASAL